MTTSKAIFFFWRMGEDFEPGSLLGLISIVNTLYQLAFTFPRGCYSFFFTFIYLERERDSQRLATFHRQVYSLNGYKGQGWVRAKPGARNSPEVTHVGDRNSATWVVTWGRLVCATAASQTWSGNGTGSQALDRRLGRTEGWLLQPLH